MLYTATHRRLLPPALFFASKPMDFRVDTRAYPLRCKTCQEETEYAICHHCRKPVCKPHTVEGGGATASASEEFADLGLDDGTEQPMHCEDCAHHVEFPSWRPVLIASASVTLGVIIFFAGARWIGGLLSIFSLAAVVWFWKQRQQKMDAFHALSPPFPLFSLQSVRIRESLHQEIHLTADGTYESRLDDVHGSFETSVVISDRHRDSVEDYVEKFGHPPEMVDAGSIYCVTNGSVVSLDANEAPSPRPSFHLREKATEIAGLQHADADTRWTTRTEYTVSLDGSRPNPPVLVIPSYEPNMGGEGLNIEFHWDQIRGEDRPSGSPSLLHVERIDKLVIRYPAELQSVQKVGISPIVASPIHGRTDIDLQNLQCTLSRPTETDPFHAVEWENIDLKDINSIRTTLIYRESIASPTEGYTITGSLSLRLKELPTDLAPSLYTPLGASYTEKEEQQIIDRRGNIHVDFELDLSTLLFQRRLSISSREDIDNFRAGLQTSSDTSPEKDDSPRENVSSAGAGVGLSLAQDIPSRPDGSLFFASTPPSARTVLALLDSLSEIDKDFYIQNVYEEPPRATGSAKKVNRYWDIDGRWYHGVWPVDFHITLMGEEHIGEIGDAFGRTRVSLNTQGAYTNLSMKRSIAQTWINLADDIAAVMEQHTAPVEPDDIFFPDLHDEESDGGRYEPDYNSLPDNTPSASDGPEANESGNAVPGDDRAERGASSSQKDHTWKRDLEKQLYELRARFIEGKIPEEMYREMHEEIQSEIKSLDES